MNCKNCATVFDGNYCPTCGQKVILERFNLKESILWMFSSVFNFDKGFLYTTKELFIRPEKVVTSFLNGITVQYAHPFRFVFIWATISALIGTYFNVFEESGLMMNKMMGQTEEQIAKARQAMVFLKQYMSLIIVGMIPFFSLGSYLISKKKGLNYAEHLILMSYANGLSTAVGLPVFFLYLTLDNTEPLGILNLLISIIIIGRVFAKTFNESIFMGILRYIFTFIFGFISSIFFSILLMIIVILAMKVLGLSTPFAN